ncbi:hypothetical protein D3C86_1678410 [compost metagenome]
MLHVQAVVIVDVTTGDLLTTGCGAYLRILSIELAKHQTGERQVRRTQRYAVSFQDALIRYLNHLGQHFLTGHSRYLCINGLTLHPIWIGVKLITVIHCRST